MKGTICFPVLIASLVAMGTPRWVGAQELPLARMMDSLVEARAKADQFSGTVLVALGDRVLVSRSAGLAHRELRVPMTLDTRLEIASMSKLLTRIAILQLVQAGKLALGDTVGKFLPDYPNAAVRSAATVEQLLAHRSGIGSFWNAEYMARRAEIRSVNDYLALFQRDSLLFPPGTGTAYSNGGYVVLGAIIERVSGTAYHDYVRDRILRPAGMTRTTPYDRLRLPSDLAVGYTLQPLGGPMGGDRRLAGPSASADGASPRPGADGNGPRLRIIGPDGRELSPEEARQTRERRATAGAVRRPNAERQPGRSGPAGGHLSTVGDFYRLARAITGHRLLDSAHTALLLGDRYARGGDLRANGGGPGANAEFSLYPSGHVIVVLSNYDPPAATDVAEFIRSRITRPAALPGARPAEDPLRQEIEALHAEMMAAYRREPASVARYYADDASILGSRGRWIGRDQLDRYWAAPGGGEWALEVLETGGSQDSPWVRGRSTLTSRNGRPLVTEYIGILKRQPDGLLRFHLDMFVPAQPAAR